MLGVLEAFGRFLIEFLGASSDISEKAMRENLGASLRTHLLRILAFSKKEISEVEFSRLIKKCDGVLHEEIIVALLFKDAVDTLPSLKDLGYDLCVSSGMLEEQLIQVVKSKGINNCFAFILGAKNGF